MESIPDNVTGESYNLAVPLYVQIAESLLERIRIGELVPEQRLPSERELSKSLKVSRMTLRAALRVLDNKGFLVRRPGDGTYVAKPKIDLAEGLAAYSEEIIEKVKAAARAKSSTAAEPSPDSDRSRGSRGWGAAIPPKSIQPMSLTEVMPCCWERT